MANSADILAALVAKLANDATLTTLMPDGVYRDVAANSSTQYVAVSLVTGLHIPMLGGTAYEDKLYLVRAVERSTSGLNAAAAADRIHALLHNQPLTITGYSHMLTRQEETVEFTEVDESTPDTRWQTLGGRYSVTASPDA